MHDCRCDVTSSADGYTQDQNHTIFDVPISNSDWPNKSYKGKLMTETTVSVRVAALNTVTQAERISKYV